ncbi:MAG: FkbM family methyltransferase [Sphingomonadaceae bacterium]
MAGLSAAARWAMRRGHGAAVARAATLAYRLRDGPPRSFSTDPSGRGINAQPGAGFVSPTVHTAPLADIRAKTRDIFEYRYVPRPGDRVVDVGAGIGTETLVFSRQVGRAGRVVAIEAHPVTFRALAGTIARSGLDNVLAVQAAVADREGEAFITHKEAHAGNAVTMEAGGIAVPARTLDAIVAEAGLSRIDYLKMNIEGAEALAIAGMERTVAMVRNIVVSCHDFIAERDGDEAMRTFATVERYLRDRGFTLATRPDDPRPWVRYYLYGGREEGQ